MTEQVTKTIIVKGDVHYVYELWSNFENFPHFMKYIKAVDPTGPRTSHWVMEGPGGMAVDWNAEMTRQEQDKRIAWSSKDQKGVVTTSGQVTFNSLPEGETEVTATVQYNVPGGKIGEMFAKLFSDPKKRLTEDLRSFKTYAEKGIYERI